MLRIRMGSILFVLAGLASPAHADPITGNNTMQSVAHLKDFQVIELRRYQIKDGQRQRFATYFESYFPEAFEQLGAIAFGDGLERDDASHFTWFRGFHDIFARATVNGAFYYGPLWREHRNTLNELIIDSDNVILLTPLSPEHGIPVLPAVDPVREEKGAQGILVMQIFALKKDGVDAFAKQAQASFAHYRDAGAREAGILVTLDVPNNFPQLPIRSDGPYLVWLGLVKDDAMWKHHVRPAIDAAADNLTATGFLREKTELVVIDPARRSRLRWLPEKSP